MTTLDENLTIDGGEFTGVVPGRGVLEGAFILLDVLAGYEDGAGLSELARAAGLPKATTYRLVQQLVELGAVERHGSRYIVGRLLVRLGAGWRPNLELHQAALEPVRALAARSKAAVTVSVLRDGNLRAVTSAPGATGAEAYALPVGRELAARTAAGLVLFAAEAGGAHNRDLPWRGGQGPKPNWADRLAVDQQNVLPGVCCVATAVCLPDGRPVAAISALTFSTAVPGGLGDQVRQASWAITRNLAVPRTPG